VDPTPRSRIDRREFLRRSLVAGAAASLAPGIVSCGRNPSGRPLGRSSPAGPWRISGANPPIEDGLPMEHGATLRVFEWRDYLARSVLDSYERRFHAHGVRVKVQSFYTMDEAIARLRRPDARFDVFFPSIDSLGPLVAARLLRPLNHAYLPNLRNLWPSFLGASAPDYDPGQRYTVPYTVYSSGVGWRSDLAPAAPDRAADPFDALWDRRNRGHVGIYDNYREALAMALLRRGVDDVGSASDAQVRAAADDLIDVLRIERGRITTGGGSEGLAEGDFWVHQAWSGDVIAAARYRRREGAPAGDLRYWWPGGRAGIVGVDLTAVLSTGRNPVAAHAFLNHLLETETALQNFAWNGYQPPVREATAEALRDPDARWGGIVPRPLLGALIDPDEFERAQSLARPDPGVDARWRAQWARVIAAAPRRVDDA
jgi:spermidine/putrescine transport system substrate-binding protein